MLFIPGMPVTGFQGAAANELVHCNLVRQCDDNRLGFDFERARRNYIALARGARLPSQLSAVEAQEVRELLKLKEQKSVVEQKGL